MAGCWCATLALTDAERTAVAAVVHAMRVRAESVASAPAIPRVSAIGSAELGAIGEDDVYRILAAKYKTVRTRSTPHAGDMVVAVGDCKILVEVKNYTANINKGEFDKFVSDVDTTHADAGVIISLRSGFARRHGVGVDVRTQGTKQVPVMWVSQPSTDMLTMCVDTLVHVANTYARLNAVASTSSLAQERLDVAARIVAAVRDELMQCTADFAAKHARIMHKFTALETQLNVDANYK